MLNTSSIRTSEEVNSIQTLKGVNSIQGVNKVFRILEWALIGESGWVFNRENTKTLHTAQLVKN